MTHQNAIVQAQNAMTQGLQPADIKAAIDRQRPGWTLDQMFYASPEIFEYERKNYLPYRWYVLGHISELPETGSHIVRDLLGESVIAVRDGEGTVRGFYNVCRHRGSRICDKDGRAQSLVCPYHAWSYRLDGSVRNAPAMPEGVDLKQRGLVPIPLRVIGGVILGSLKADPAGLDDITPQAEAVLQYQGIPTARIAARRRHLTKANWKLVMENWYECYHCLPNHPEFCSVMKKHVDVMARDAGEEAEAAWEAEQDQWSREVSDPSSPVQISKRTVRTPMLMGEVSRSVIGGGLKTQSKDGEPVAPLMGQIKKYDGGINSFGVRPFSSVKMLNDYAVIFQFYPVSADETDIYFTWLVNGGAKDSDFDLERLLWCWDVTVAQDTILSERNAAGVKSAAYTPGPYSKLEQRTSSFIGNYLKELAHSFAKI